ncbi:hypothetical protein GL50803_0015497 [Giardia duodenalis]|uniref:Uncharacterized protein n=1 Tax=Giardia intestinalis (strain ATCC 50803 / WB clone C6) TaxID=184922 RepID=A8B8T2_GIAIC|nr:hypothetical protein GL50803_0015497 [Giardia intestinalis]KAE8302399.1 hypothetical protein GL50803_0015497 [Giardia intestinalis]|eukprot:XP_001708680.1 Hypothetical protein GL50803_15497 [Giardia lamblia ATCC 50803]
MWFGHDVGWVERGKTDDAGKNVSLRIYRYRVRGCLKKAYFFTLAVWDLEFTYLDNGLSTRNIMVLDPGELENFPNFRLFQTIFLGHTNLAYSSFPFTIENMPFNSASHMMTSIGKQRGTQPGSSSASRYISRSSSIGHELNITLSQSYSPTNPSRADCSVSFTPNQRIFIDDLSYHLLNQTNAHSVLAKFVTNASLSNLYFSMKPSANAHANKDFIIYMGNDNYRLVEASYVKLLLALNTNPAKYFRRLISTSFDQLLLGIEQMSRDSNPQPAQSTQPAQALCKKDKREDDRRESVIGSIQNASEDQANAHLSPESKRGSSGQAIETNPLVVPSLAIPSSRFHKKQRHQRQSSHKVAQQGIVSLKHKGLKRGQGHLTPELGGDANEPLYSAGDVASPQLRDHLLVQNFDMYPVRRLSRHKHLRMRSAGAVDDVFKELSDDSCLDELVNVQPYMKNEEVISNQDALISQNNEESVDVIVDNVVMSSKNYLPVHKAQAENVVSLWGQMTARELVHGGSV